MQLRSSNYLVSKSIESYQSNWNIYLSKITNYLGFQIITSSVAGKVLCPRILRYSYRFVGPFFYSIAGHKLQDPLCHATWQRQRGKTWITKSHGMPVMCEFLVHHVVGHVFKSLCPTSLLTNLAGSWEKAMEPLVSYILESTI